MTEHHQTPRIAANLIWRQVDENTVIVSPQNGEMQVLNGVGSTIWQLLDEQKSPDFIVTYLTDYYNVSHEQAYSDLQNFLADLEERCLVEWES